MTACSTTTAPGRPIAFDPARGGGFVSPPGLYAVLEQDKRGFLLRHRHGFVTRFDPPDRGGRLRRLEDRNGNAITLAYRADEITIVDTLSRTITIAMADGLIHQLRDHAGRAWTYRYDADARLIEVVRPATTGFPDGTSVRYGYDDQHRLTTITDPERRDRLSSTATTNEGRIVAQEHGEGVVPDGVSSSIGRARGDGAACGPPAGLPTAAR